MVGFAARAGCNFVERLRLRGGLQPRRADSPPARARSCGLWKGGDQGRRAYMSVDLPPVLRSPAGRLTKPPQIAVSAGCGAVASAAGMRVGVALGKRRLMEVSCVCLRVGRRVRSADACYAPRRAASRGLRWACGALRRASSGKIGHFSTRSREVPFGAREKPQVRSLRDFSAFIRDVERLTKATHLSLWLVRISGKVPDFARNVLRFRIRSSPAARPRHVGGSAQRVGGGARSAKGVRCKMCAVSAGGGDGRALASGAFSPRRIPICVAQCPGSLS